MAPPRQKIYYTSYQNMQKQYPRSRNNFSSVPKTPAKNSRAPIIRPRKCHNCQKMIAASKYNQHCEGCYRFKNEAPAPVKLVTNTVKNQPVARVQSLHHNQYGKSSLQPKEEQIQKKMSVKVVQSNGKFRIREVPKSQTKNDSKKQSIFISKVPSERLRDSRKRNGNPQIERSEENELIKVQHIRSESDSQPDREYQKTPQIYRIQTPNNSQHRLTPTNSQIRSRQLEFEQVDFRPVRNQESSEDQIIFDENNQPIYIAARERERSPIPPLNRPLLNTNPIGQNIQQQNQRIPVVNIRNNRPVIQLTQNPQDPSENMRDLISSSNDIISFIEGMGDLQDQALQIMVTQLRQINMIAMQVSDLDTIGNNLGFRMGTVFARRIRELQTTIVNQIGIFLVRRFHERVGLPDFEEFLIRQPQLRTGFTPAQANQIFPQKVSYKTLECSICLQDIQIGSMLKQLQCNHNFHPDCIDRWLEGSKQCPICRRIQQIR